MPKDMAVASRLAVILLMASVALLGSTARREISASYNLECWGAVQIRAVQPMSQAE